MTPERLRHVRLIMCLLPGSAGELGLQHGLQPVWRRRAGACAVWHVEFMSSFNITVVHSTFFFRGCEFLDRGHTLQNTYTREGVHARCE